MERFTLMQGKTVLIEEMMIASRDIREVSETVMKLVKSENIEIDRDAVYSIFPIFEDKAVFGIFGGVVRTINIQEIIDSMNRSRHILCVSGDAPISHYVRDESKIVTIQFGKGDNADLAENIKLYRPGSIDPEEIIHVVNNRFAVDVVDHICVYYEGRHMVTLNIKIENGIVILDNLDYAHKRHSNYTHESNCEVRSRQRRIPSLWSADKTFILNHDDKDIAKVTVPMMLCEAGYKDIMCSLMQDNNIDILGKGKTVLYFQYGFVPAATIIDGVYYDRNIKNLNEAKDQYGLLSDTIMRDHIRSACVRKIKNYATATVYNIDYSPVYNGIGYVSKVLPLVEEGYDLKEIELLLYSRIGKVDLADGYYFVSIRTEDDTLGFRMEIKNKAIFLTASKDVVIPINLYGLLTKEYVSNRSIIDVPKFAVAHINVPLFLMLGGKIINKGINKFELEYNEDLSPAKAKLPWSVPVNVVDAEDYIIRGICEFMDINRHDLSENITVRKLINSIDPDRGQDIDLIKVFSKFVRNTILRKNGGNK